MKRKSKKNNRKKKTETRKKKTNSTRNCNEWKMGKMRVKMKTKAIEIEN